MTRSALTMGAKMKKVLSTDYALNPKRNYTPKKHYYIMDETGSYCGETWAVSPEKAVTNWWWNYIKDRNEMTPAAIRPEDLDAVEAD